MRNAMFVVVGLCALLLWAPVVQAAQSEDWLDLELLDRGAIVIQYDVKPDVKTKLMIVKDQDRYTYVLSPDKRQETFPLQMGNGDYTITVLEHTGGTKYKIVQEAAVTLQLTDDSEVFTNSVQNIEWSEGDEVAQLALQLTESAGTDDEKVQAVYDYIVSTIRYDKALASGDLTGYLPDNNRTIEGRKGMCYDYASLFASMLRSIGTPAKLVMGTSEHVDVYHAWNEVYMNGEWITIDTTVDASWKSSGLEFKMMKDASDYSAVKTY